VVVVIVVVVVVIIVGVVTDVFAVSGVDIVVVTSSDVVVIMVVISDFLGTRITNFNTRDRLIANIVRTIKDMPMILTQRWCHHLCGPILSEANSRNSWL
jgi:hypothetical protein